MKKKIIVIIIAVAAIAVVAGSITAYQKHKKEEARKEQLYKKYKAELRMNSMELVYALCFIVRDYSLNMSNAISEGQSINSSSQWTDCDNPSDAISKRWTFYINQGSFTNMDSCLQRYRDNIMAMQKLGIKDNDSTLVLLCLKEMPIIDEGINLVKKPSGSVLNFNVKAGNITERLRIIDNKIAHINPNYIDKESNSLMLYDLHGQGLLQKRKAEPKKDPKTKKVKYTFTKDDEMWYDLNTKLNNMYN